ncbi:MAG: hypothetical protein K2X93_24080 [Candidatus Obscuribacterales bacterium]|nr:hypothetical protein [Candidatus Obscuribacterales bacterium]
MLECARDLEREHPNLIADADYLRTSKCTDSYNCLAYAAGDLSNWWEPTKLPPYKWPLPQYDYLPASFQTAFAEIGFTLTDTCDVEEGMEVIAVFVDADGDVCHAALRDEDGAWKSKCGDRFDIRHSLCSIDYGTLSFYMKRERVARPLPEYSEPSECEYHKSNR